MGALKVPLKNDSEEEEAFHQLNQKIKDKGRHLIAIETTDAVVASFRKR
jgi:hypothetical protein